MILTTGTAVKSLKERSNARRRVKLAVESGGIVGKLLKDKSRLFSFGRGIDGICIINEETLVYTGSVMEILILKSNLKKSRYIMSPNVHQN